MKINELVVNTENPRHDPVFDEIGAMSILLKDSVKMIELADSILKNGYFEAELLIIYQDEDSNRVVMDGNRRLTILKLVKDSNLYSRFELGIRLKSILDEIHGIEDDIGCVVETDLNKVVNYVIKKHTEGDPVVKWNPVMQYRFKKRYLKISDPVYEAIINYRDDSSSIMNVSTIHDRILGSKERRKQIHLSDDGTISDDFVDNFNRIIDLVNKKDTKFTSRYFDQPNRYDEFFNQVLPNDSNQPKSKKDSNYYEKLELHEDSKSIFYGNSFDLKKNIKRPHGKGKNNVVIESAGHPTSDIKQTVFTDVNVPGTYHIKYKYVNPEAKPYAKTLKILVKPLEIPNLFNQKSYSIFTNNALASINLGKTLQDIIVQVNDLSIEKYYLIIALTYRPLIELASKEVFTRLEISLPGNLENKMLAVFEEGKSIDKKTLSDKCKVYNISHNEFKNFINAFSDEDLKSQASKLNLMTHNSANWFDKTTTYEMGNKFITNYILLCDLLVNQ